MNKRLLYVACIITISVIFFVQCIGEREQPDLRGPQYAGAEACISCHKPVYDSFLATAHHTTSGPGSKDVIMGSFTPPENTFTYSNGMQIKMEQRDSGLFQSQYLDGKLQLSHRFDMTIGSGTKAQTFFYWKDYKYYQLPLSYFVPSGSWANSPGFPVDHPRFDRVIPSTCFGCHSSMATVKETKLVGTALAEEFDKNKVIYGIDCERCHGPAAAHVEFHQENPGQKQAKYITLIDTLKNQLKLDMCAVCHSGIKKAQKPLFGFKPGNSLSDYYFPDPVQPVKPKEMDVHGTQYQLFTASQCFVQSKQMNCSSCHKPHASEKSDLTVFSKRCMSCHQEASHNFCKLTSLPAATLKQNCIDCHMPALPSRQITLLTNGKETPSPDFIRTHFISIYPDDTRKIVEHIRGK